MAYPTRSSQAVFARILEDLADELAAAGVTDGTPLTLKYGTQTLATAEA